MGFCWCEVLGIIKSNHDDGAVRRAVALAIINSSSVRMTRTLTGARSVEIRRALDAFRYSSRAIPRNPSPAQNPPANLRRMLTDPSGEYQRVDSAKAAGIAPTHFFTW